MKTSKVDQMILFREGKDMGHSPDKGKMLPHFQRCGFPLQKPPADYLTHIRRDGDVKMTISANGEYGMPYGADVLTLLWLFSAAVKQKSRTVKFRFAAEMLCDMGLDPQTYNYQMISKSIDRIFGATYFFEWFEERRKRKQGDRLIDNYDLWCKRENDEDIPLTGPNHINKIVLSQFAWNWLNRSPWLDTEPAYAMRKTPGAIQLYFVIAQRAPRLRGPKDLVDIPVTGPQGLDKQIGGVTYEGQEGQKRWRQLLRKWLQQIRVGWPTCPAELIDLTDTPIGNSTGRRGWYLRICWCEKQTA